MDKDKLEKLLDQREALTEKALDSLKEKVIGQHVAALVAKDGNLSLSALMAALEHSASSAPEPERMKADAAAKYLDGLLEKGAV